MDGQIFLAYKNTKMHNKKLYIMRRYMMMKKSPALLSQHDKGNDDMKHFQLPSVPIIVMTDATKQVTGDRKITMSKIQ